jgi:hypothetical protein
VLTTHELGDQILELRTVGSAENALALLRDRGIAGADAVTVGTTVTVPLHAHAAADAIAGIQQAGVQTAAITTREPTLDDVYLRLTGGQLSAAA